MTGNELRTQAQALLSGTLKNSRGAALAAMLVPLGALGTQSAQAGVAVPVHQVNGAFDPNEWTVSSSNGAPARPTVSATTFAVAGGAGGSVLYAEQTNLGNPLPFNGTGGSFGNTLELMYDFTNSPSALGAGAVSSNSSFDVFFQVKPTNTDYAIHINGAGFRAFEKPGNVPSGENPDGTLHVTDAAGNPVGPWLNTDAGDQQLAKFQGVIGFGSSPNSPTPHLMAEFALSIDTGDPNQPGLYSPAPAFWSASSKGTSGDPPISSGIFQLNPNGSMTVSPVLGANGAPVAQPQDVSSPEPASLALLAMGAGGLLSRRRR